MRSLNDFEKSLQKRRDSQPARAYLWAVEMPNLLVPPSNGSQSESFRTAVDERSSVLEDINMKLLNTLITSINTPFFNIETDKVIDGSTFWYKATHNDISNISITFEEQQDGIVWKYLNNWKNLIISSNGGYNPPSYYKRDIKLYRLDLSKRVFQIFTYKNYFISEVAALGNDYTSNSAVQYTASFTGDALAPPETFSGAYLNQQMEEVSNLLGGIEIPYDRFKFSGVPSPAIANLLGTIASRVI